jgi:hypothetical protein
MKMYVGRLIMIPYKLRVKCCFKAKSYEMFPPYKTLRSGTMKLTQRQVKNIYMHNKFLKNMATFNNRL